MWFCPLSIMRRSRNYLLDIRDQITGYDRGWRQTAWHRRCQVWLLQSGWRLQAVTQLVSSSYFPGLDRVDSWLLFSLLTQIVSSSLWSLVGLVTTYPRIRILYLVSAPFSQCHVPSCVVTVVWCIKCPMSLVIIRYLKQGSMLALVHTTQPLEARRELNLGSAKYLSSIFNLFVTSNVHS